MISAAVLRGEETFARDFKLIRPLAEGGMGAVYVAQQLSTGKLRALKLMQPELVADPRARQRFTLEAAVGAQIDSAHVVEVVTAGIDEPSSTPWIAMELLEGHDLAQHVQERGRMDPNELYEMFRQLGHALAAAHAKGIVHRDLKPENVFVARSRRVDAPFTVKVLDFGIAKLTQESGQTSRRTAAIGSPLWMAPEQTDASTPIRPSTDVWALGLIAFYALTGRFYWRAANVEDIRLPALLAEQLTSLLEPPTQRAYALGVPMALPQGFDAWFLRCVARAQDARFPDAGSAIAALGPGMTSGAAQGPHAVGTAPTQAMPHYQDPRHVPQPPYGGHTPPQPPYGGHTPPQPPYGGHTPPQPPYGGHTPPQPPYAPAYGSGPVAPVYGEGTGPMYHGASVGPGYGATPYTAPAQAAPAGRSNAVLWLLALGLGLGTCVMTAAVLGVVEYGDELAALLDGERTTTGTPDAAVLEPTLVASAPDAGSVALADAATTELARGVEAPPDTAEASAAAAEEAGEEAPEDAPEPASARSAAPRDRSAPRASFTWADHETAQFTGRTRFSDGYAYEFTMPLRRDGVSVSGQMRWRIVSEGAQHGAMHVGDHGTMDIGGTYRDGALSLQDQYGDNYTMRIAGAGRLSGSVNGGRITGRVR